MKPIKAEQDGTKTTLTFPNGRTSVMNHGSESAAKGYIEGVEIDPDSKPAAVAAAAKPAGDGVAPGRGMGSPRMRARAAVPAKKDPPPKPEGKPFVNPIVARKAAAAKPKAKTTTKAPAKKKPAAKKR